MLRPRGDASIPRAAGGAPGRWDDASGSIHRANSVFALENVGAAFRRLQDKERFGKIVLRLDDE
jgi:hypothetical protein